MVEDVDPTTREDAGQRVIFRGLMNLGEKQQAIRAEQAAEIQRLRDEINRLKGEQGKAKIKANTQKRDRSSEKQRRQSHPHHKSSTQAQIKSDREELVKVDPQHLPTDATFKGYQEVVVQDVLFQTEHIRFHKEKSDSPSQKHTSLAQVPAGSHGQCGPGGRAWVLALYDEGGMSEPKILEVLQTVGMQISAGHLSDVLITQQDIFHAEKAAVWRAGLLSSPWHHLESTGTRVNGSTQHCHVLCNPLSSSYHTTPCTDRLSIRRVLQGGAELGFHVNAKALELLEHLGVRPRWRGVLTSHRGQEHVFTEEQREAFLSAKQLRMGPAVRKLVKAALGIAASHTQTASPVITLLLCDDAPQFEALTAE